MKKVLTILVVLALVAGFAFADGNDPAPAAPAAPSAHSEAHTLRVKADVTEVLPVFNLFHVEGKDTNTNAEEFAKNAKYESLMDDDKAQDVGFKLDSAGSFTVTAEVINNVKTNKSFTIEFAGGVFTVNRKTVEGKYSPKQIKVVNGGTNEAIKEFGTARDSSVNTSITTDTTSTLKASTSVTFSGKKGNVATTPITIATATYDYAGDDSIDPTAKDEYYYADVTMTITSTY